MARFPHGFLIRSVYLFDFYSFGSVRPVPAWSFDVFLFFALTFILFCYITMMPVIEQELPAS